MAARCNIIKLLPLALILQFFIAAPNLANDQKSPVEDYVHLISIYFNAVTTELDWKVKEFKSIYEAKFHPIETEQLLLQLKCDEAENILTALEMTGDASKYCVGQYRGQIPNKNEVSRKIMKCSEIGLLKLASILKNPIGKKNTLINYHKNELPPFLQECKTRYGNDKYNYIVCVDNVLGAAHSFTTYKKQDFEKSLKASERAAEYHSLDGIECSFNILYNSIASINATLIEINKCIDNERYYPERELYESQYISME